jgi:hypothetical protein
MAGAQSETPRVSQPAYIDQRGLYDCARLSRELGISRKAAEAMMRGLPKQKVPGLRKIYVRGSDVQRRLDENLEAA